MKSFVYILLMLLIVSLSFRCSHRINSVQDKKGHIKRTAGEVGFEVFKSTDFPLSFDLKPEQALDITYLGCGGFSIENQGEIMLIDPFFSNPNFLLKSTGLIKMKSKTKIIKQEMDKVCNSADKAIHSIWVSHSHYDHLMDVPYVFNTYADTVSTKIYCSQSGKNMINGVDAIQTHNIVVLDHLGSDAEHWVSSIYLMDSSLRITPILTHHAPHSQVGNKDIEFYKGESQPKHKYTKSTDRSRAGWWKLGQTFSFLIDYLDTVGQVTFRMYIQSSASDPGQGWIPPVLKNQHPVNLAILGIASFEYVESYPESLLEHLAPEKLIICHWEDFFLKYDRKKERLVRQTKLKEGIRRINLVYPWKINEIEQFSLPHPGVKIKIR